jgi:hypothetical protein
MRRDWSVLLSVLAAALAVSQVRGADVPVAPQALAAAIGKDPSFLPATPASTTYRQGTAPQISASDARAGVIAEFLVAFDYRVPEPTTGLTYRVFRDAGEAQRYFGSMSEFNAPGFITPQGNSIAAVEKSTFSAPDPQKAGFRTITCETFLDPRAEYRVTARCASVSEVAPVIVSGIRIQRSQAAERSNDGTVTHTLNPSDRNAADAIAIGVVTAGLQRVMAEWALLAAGVPVGR